MSKVRLTDPVTDLVTDPVECLILAIGKRTLAPSEIQQELHMEHLPTFLANYLH